MVELDKNSPTPTEQRITELYAWIAIQPDGGEGIIAGILPGIGASPLVHSKERVARMLKPAAEETRALSSPGTRIVLRRFQCIEDVAI